jgi:hypothetical protein
VRSETCLRSEVRLSRFFRLLHVLAATDREIKGFCPPALPLISYNNFASSTGSTQQSTPTLDGLVLWQLHTLLAVQYAAIHSNPGWCCDVATVHTLLAVQSSTVQYTASHFYPGWSCAVATVHTLSRRCCSVLSVLATSARWAAELTPRTRCRRGPLWFTAKFALRPSLWSGEAAQRSAVGGVAGSCPMLERSQTRQSEPEPDVDLCGITAC